jgi:hypothetical protein
MRHQDDGRAGIAGSQDFIPRVGDRFELSRDFANGCM